MRQQGGGWARAPHAALQRVSCHARHAARLERPGAPSRCSRATCLRCTPGTAVGAATCSAHVGACNLPEDSQHTGWYKALSLRAPRQCFAHQTGCCRAGRAALRCDPSARPRRRSSSGSRRASRTSGSGSALRRTPSLTRWGQASLSARRVQQDAWAAVRPCTAPGCHGLTSHHVRALGASLASCWPALPAK